MFKYKRSVQIVQFMHDCDNLEDLASEEHPEQYARDHYANYDTSRELRGGVLLQHVSAPDYRREDQYEQQSPWPECVGQGHGRTHDTYGVDADLPEEGYQPKHGEQILCSNCGRTNDYDSLVKVAKKQATKWAEEQVQKELDDFAKKIGKMFK